MVALWFSLVALTLAVYVILDGYDLGAGIVQRFVAKTDAERARVIETIGPFWDGNEVWLLAAGGTIFCVFPALYASAFSGFYLPLMLVLWLIIGRGLGIEFRHQIAHPMWTGAWDWAFTLSSALLALFFGVALGNIVRGVPLDAAGHFFEPLWTNFSPWRAGGILDTYTILTGLLAVAALAHHGALWIALRTDGELQARARKLAKRFAGALAGLIPILTVWSLELQSNIGARFSKQPWGLLFPLLAIAGHAASVVFRGKRDAAAFAGSSLFLAGMLASVAFSLFPYVLPSSLDPAQGMTAHGAAADPHGLKVALAWWIPGMLLAGGYSFFVHRIFSDKVSAGD